MKALIIILISVVGAIMLLFAFALCKTASRCDRLEEKQRKNQGE